MVVSLFLMQGAIFPLYLILDIKIIQNEIQKYSNWITISDMDLILSKYIFVYLYIFYVYMVIEFYNLIFLALQTRKKHSYQITNINSKKSTVTFHHNTLYSFISLLPSTLDYLE